MRPFSFPWVWKKQIITALQDAVLRNCVCPTSLVHSHCHHQLLFKATHQTINQPLFLMTTGHIQTLLQYQVSPAGRQCHAKAQIASPLSSQYGDVTHKPVPF